MLSAETRFVVCYNYLTIIAQAFFSNFSCGYVRRVFVACTVFYISGILLYPPRLLFGSIFSYNLF